MTKVPSEPTEHTTQRRGAKSKFVFTLVAAAIVASASSHLFLGGSWATADSAPASSAERPSGPAMSINWVFRPASLRSLVAGSQAAVTATVQSMAPGSPLITEGESDVPPVPTSLVTMKVGQRWFGEVPDRLVVFMTGSSEVWSPEAPPFEVDEEYVLFVEPRGDGTYFVVAPDGRFAIAAGKVRPVAAGPLARQIRGKSVADLRRAAQTAKKEEAE